MKTNENIKPLSVLNSVLIMLVITLLLIFCFYILRPYLGRKGLNQYSAYLLSLTLISFVLITWSLVAFYLEGNVWTLRTFLQRTRLGHLELKVLAWAIGLGLVMFLSTIVFSPLLSKAISNGFLKLPDGIPDYLNPEKQQSILQLKTQFVSQGVLPWIPIVLLLNILGEELFWRGMIFPRQELRHGSGTFLVHGSLWAFTHLFQYWILPPIFIGSIALAYVVQRTKNTWTGILAHFLNNSLPFIIMIFIR